MILANRLHRRTGQTSGMVAALNYIIPPLAVYIAYCNNIAVGASVVSPYFEFSLMVYVDPDYRRQGIGTKLAQASHKHLSSFKTIIDASTRSKAKFWRKSLD